MSKLQHKSCAINPNKQESWDILTDLLDKGWIIIWSDVINDIVYMIISKED